MDHKDILMARYGNLKVTHAFAHVLENVSTEVAIRMLDVLDDLIRQVRHAQKIGESPYEIVGGVIEAMNNAEEKPRPNQPQITCRKGCAFCCHNQVMISEIEASAIWEYCKLNDIDIDIEYLRRQTNLDEQSHPRASNSACVFLGIDRSCKIYEFRPLICRKYKVASDPKFCDVKTAGRHGVLEVTNAEQEMLLAALGNVAKSNDSIARSLLRTRPK